MMDRIFALAIVVIVCVSLYFGSQTPNITAEASASIQVIIAILLAFVFICVYVCLTKPDYYAVFPRRTPVSIGKSLRPYARFVDNKNATNDVDYIEVSKIGESDTFSPKQKRFELEGDESNVVDN